MADNKQTPAVQQPKKVPVVNQVKSILAEENVKKRFQEVLTATWDLRLWFRMTRASEILQPVSGIR